MWPITPIPSRLRFMWGMLSLESRKGARSISRCIRSYFSMGKFSIASMCCSPAMLARYLISPSLAASATALATSSSLQRSVWMKIICPPRSRAIFWVFLPSFSLMSSPTAMRPFAAAAIAVARPMPVPAPVTMHTFPTVKLSSFRTRICSRVISGSRMSMDCSLPRTFRFCWYVKVSGERNRKRRCRGRNEQAPSGEARKQNDVSSYSAAPTAEAIPGPRAVPGPGRLEMNAVMAFFQMI